MKCVLTGGCGVGKTTLINMLSKRYNIVPEVYTKLFNESTKEFHNDDENRRKIINLKIELESKLNNDEINFLDRSLVDNLAFGYYYGNDMKEYDYKHVHT